MPNFHDSTIWIAIIAIAAILFLLFGFNWVS